MNASQLFRAAIHALSPDSPAESFVGEDTEVGPLTPGALRLPVEGVLPSFDGAIAWLNSPPLTPAGLRGTVVVADFWTYTCINWLRTLPYVRAWAEKYRDHGLVTIGVHSPEFPFEHDIDNVRRAAAEMRVTYPIAVDSDFGVWRAFNNHYWPALYIADAQGQIRYHHFGEGAYDEAEMVIQQLLGEAGLNSFEPTLVSGDAHGIEVAADWSNLESPETYLGYERAENFASPGGATWDRRRLYAAPAQLSLNEWALSGDWTVAAGAAVSNVASGRIAYRFHSRDLHLVLAPPAGGTSVRFRVLLDGRVPGDAHGGDVDDQGNGVVMEPRLYQLIRQRQPVEDRQFEIEFLDPGVEAYVFTFG
jgi:thiol-disulfide isomerase/thioredoxin